MEPGSKPEAFSKDNRDTQFDVFCVHKHATSTASECGTSSASGSGPPSTALTYKHVVDELSSEHWSFDPYPRCTRDQLLQVHSYWVAVPKRRSAASALAASDGHTKTLLRGGSNGSRLGETASANVALTSHNCVDAAAPPAFCCVVGIVWVRLSGSALRAIPQMCNANFPADNATATQAARQHAVEGYLQIVLTHPNYRQQGLASWLLRLCLAKLEAPADVFASSNGSEAACAIRQWRLHTLMAPSARITLKHRRVETCSSASTGDGGHTDLPAVINATLSMYKRLGFVERRYHYQYYANMQDAVELFLQR